MRFALLCLSLTAAASAQPSAADSALAERALGVSQVERSVRLLHAEAVRTRRNLDLGAEGVPLVIAVEAERALRPIEAVTLQAASDSVRAALWADWRPELAAGAVQLWEGPIAHRIDDELASPDRPYARGLSDERIELAERYRDALWTSRTTPDALDFLDVHGYAAFVRALPDSLRDVPAIRARLATAFEDDFAQDALQLVGTLAYPLPRDADPNASWRLLQTVSNETLQDLTDHFASAAGRYLSGRATLGLVRAVAAPVLETTMRLMVLERLDDLWEDGEPIGPVPQGGLRSMWDRVHYPEAALADGVGGLVVVGVRVSEEGRVVETSILESPDDRLSDAARTAVAASRFLVRRDTEAGWYAVPVRFDAATGRVGSRAE